MNASEYDRMVEEDESECGRPLNGTGHELIGGTRLSSCSKGVLKSTQNIKHVCFDWMESESESKAKKMHHTLCNIL